MYRGERETSGRRKIQGKERRKKFFFFYQMHKSNIGRHRKQHRSCEAWHASPDASQMNPKGQWPGSHSSVRNFCYSFLRVQSTDEVKILPSKDYDFSHSNLTYLYIHTYTYTNTYKHKYIHDHTHTHIYIYIYTHKNIYTYVYIQTN